MNDYSDTDYRGNSEKVRREGPKCQECERLGLEAKRLEAKLEDAKVALRALYCEVARHMGWNWEG